MARSPRDRVGAWLGRLLQGYPGRWLGRIAEQIYADPPKK